MSPGEGPRRAPPTPLGPTGWPPARRPGLGRASSPRRVAAASQPLAARDPAADRPPAVLTSALGSPPQVSEPPTLLFTPPRRRGCHRLSALGSRALLTLPSPAPRAQHPDPPYRAPPYSSKLNAAEVWPLGRPSCLSGVTQLFPHSTSPGGCFLEGARCRHMFHLSGGEACKMNHWEPQTALVTSFWSPPPNHLPYSWSWQPTSGHPSSVRPPRAPPSLLCAELV